MIVMLKNVRISFPALFQPSGMPGQEPKFNATFLIEKGSENETKVRDVIKQVAKQAFGDKAKIVLDKQAGTDREILKDGDTKTNSDGEKLAGYDGNYYLKASNKTKVRVVGRQKEDLHEIDGKPYGGCYVNAQIDIWPQNNKFGSFVNCRLLAVQFWADGEAFGGGSAADIDAFETAEDDLADW